MTHPPVTAVPFESAAAAARRMTEKGVNRLPVVAMDGRLVGILTRTDLIRAFVRPDHVIAAEIRDEVLRRVLWLTPDAIAVDVHDGEVDLAGTLDTQAEADVLAKLVAQVPGVVAVRSAVTSNPRRRLRATERGERHEHLQEPPLRVRTEWHDGGASPCRPGEAVLDAALPSDFKNGVPESGAPRSC